MIIVVDQYNKQKTILTNSAPKAPQYFKDNHYESLEGVLTYEFEVRADDKATAVLVAGNGVLVRDLDMKLMKFTILRTHESRNSDGVYVRRVYAENSAVGDLIGHVVTGAKLIATNPKQAGNYVLQGTGWQVGMVDSVGIEDVDLNDFPTGLAGLHKIREAFGLELEFSIHWNGQRIISQFVHFVKKRGRRTGKRFTHTKDLVGVTRDEDRSDMCTAIVPIGKADEDGKRLTLGGHNGIFEGWVSPPDQNWIGDNEALQRFGVAGKHIFGRVEFSNIDDVYALMKEGVAELKKRNKPRMTYEMQVALLERLAEWKHETVRLGDHVLVKDTGFEPYLAVDARVIAINRSYTDPSQDRVVLGEFVPLIIEPNKQIEAIQSQINSNMSKWEAKGETVFKSKIAPIKSKRFPDMLWLDTSREPNVMKRWDAETNTWVKATATEASEVGAETPDGATAKAKEAEEKAIETAEKDATQKKAEAILEANEYTNETVVEAMEETIIKTKSYVDGLVPEIEAELQKHADAVAKDAEDNAKLYTEQYSEKAMHVGDKPPADTTKLWMDTTKKPFVLKKFDGKEWVSTSPQVPADIGAPDIEEVMKKANEARDSAITEAKKDASTQATKARQDAIAEAKKMDESIKTIAQQAEKNANAHTDEVTKLVEEALKKDSQDKANTAQKNAVDQALQNAKVEAENARKKAEANAKTEAERLTEEARKKAEAEAKKYTDSLSVSGTNLLLGTKDVVHEVVNGANKPHSYFTFVPNAIKDIQGKDITMSLRLSGKIGTLGTTNPWIGLEIRIDFEDGTTQYPNARFEKDIKINTQYDRQLVVGTTRIVDKPIKSLTAYALARDFTGGTLRMEEFKVGIGSMFSGYDRPEVEVLEEVRATIGSTAGQNLALNSAGKLGWIGWSATQSGVADKWTIGDTGALNGFTKVFRLVNKQPSTSENFLINTIPVANARVLGKKLQFGGWIYTESMTTGGIRFYMRARGTDASGKEVLKYANAGAQNDIRGKHWQWVTFEFNDWSNMTSVDEIRITANCLKGSNGEACVTGVMMKVSEVSSEWTPSPLDFEELASDAGILTKGTLAAERLYGQTIDGNRANFVNLNASNISTGTLDAKRLKAGSITAELLEFGGRSRDVAENRPVTYTGGNGFSINGGMTARYNGAGSSRADKFPCTMSLDFGTVIGECVRIQWTSFYSNDARYAVRSYKLETSLDGTNWTTWADVTDNTNPIVSHGVAGSGQVRYVRLTVRAPQEGQTSVNVANFEVLSVQAGTIITGDSILTGRIDATKVNVDNLNAGNIKSGTLHADRIGADSINASKIQAGAITTEKLHVLAKSLVANTSLTGNDSLGWRVGKHASSTSLLRGSENMGDILVHKFTTAEHETPTTYDSLTFEVDPNQTYKFAIGMFLDKNTRNSSQYFGLKAYDKNMKELPMQPLNPTTGALSGAPRTNPYFWSGKEVSGSWRYMEGYALSSQSEGNEAPQGRNIQASYQMHPATKFMIMRFYSGYYPTAKNQAMEVLWHSPSVTAVDSGTIVAERIVAGTLDANKVNVTNLKANNITSGTMTADRINGGTINANNTNIINIKAGNINTGTLNASQVNITNMNASNITTGTLSADRIGAKSITVDKMIIGDFSNLCSNPDFEQDGGWFGTVTRIDSSNASVPAGAPTKFVGRQTQRDGKGSDWFAVKQGEQFYVSGYVASKNSNHGATIGVYFFDKDGKAVSASGTGYKTKENGQWQYHESWTTAPANAVKAYVWTQINAFENFGEWFFTKIEVRRKNTGHMIVDGAIVASKIATNAVTADKIVAGAVNASKISANAIDASKIASNAVTTDKLSANAVNASKIQAGAITADKIATNAISASMIQTGTLDASKVTINNLTANRITGGTMSADRISGGTINANTTNIINLKAQNIASGTINADNVEISNGRVTIGKAGVQVTEADFLVKDARTGFTHSMQSQTNLIADHSFELLTPNTAGNLSEEIYMPIDPSYVNKNSIDGWMTVGSPYITDGYKIDTPDDASAFGRKAVRCNTNNYVWTDFRVEAGKQYTISFHVSKPINMNSTGAPQVQVEYVRNGSVVSSEVKNFAQPSTPAGQYVRYGFTVTAPATLNHEKDNRIRLRFRVNNYDFLLYDGIQAVQGNRAVPYDSEDSLFMMSNNRLTPVQMSLRNLMMQGNTRIEAGGLSIAGQNINGVGLEMSQRLRIWGDNPIEVRQSHVEAYAYRCIGSRPAGTDRMLWLGWHDQAGNALYGFIGGSWKVIARL